MSVVQMIVFRGYVPRYVYLGNGTQKKKTKSNTSLFITYI